MSREPHEEDRLSNAVGPDDDFFDDDTPADAAASARLAVAEEESQMEQDRRSTGSYADSQARLARVLNVFTEMALRRHAAAGEK